MTVLSAQTIRKLRLVRPLLEAFKDPAGNSAGLSACGYDITVDQNVTLPPGAHQLASAIERFDLPNNVMGIVHDKSSWARRGLAVYNTVLEPGWRGFLTLELKNNGDEQFNIVRGQAIGQVVFSFLDYHTELPYVGKYQDQERGPQRARRA